MNSNKILGAPIIINLDGSFVAPTATGEYAAGQISPDLRLPHLDAFLEQLSHATKGQCEGIGNMIAETVDKLTSKLSDRHNAVSCTLKIGCVVDPITHSMEYTFDVTAKADAK
jgi:hypothetical protein